MNGSVRKKGNTWYYSFELARVGGKRKRIERSGGRTKKEALRKMRESMLEYEKAGQLIDESDMSLADYLDYWYENYAKVNLKYNTLEYYRMVIDKHLKPSIGFYRLASITPANLQKFINSKQLSGYSKSSVQGFRNVLSSAFRMAVYPYQFIKQDPMRHITMPKFDQIKSDGELKIISTDDFKSIMGRFPRGTTFYVPLQIGFNTGFRAGEVCGLTWDCVDLNQKTLRVEKILIMKTKGVSEYGTPKTPSSIRTISISDSLVKILKSHKRDQIENRLKYGQYYTESNHVCTKENGEPVTTNTLKYLSRVINHELHINFNFHSLRHTHASMLLAAGANIKAIQERLGHSKIATTMDIYAHITKDLHASTAQFLEQISSQIE